MAIKPGHRVYIGDRPTRAVELQAGFLLVGFGKGTFKFKEEEPDANPETHIPLALVGSDTTVLVDNKMKTLKKAVDEKRKTEPSPKITEPQLRGGARRCFGSLPACCGARCPLRAVP